MGEGHGEHLIFVCVICEEEDVVVCVFFGCVVFVGSADKQLDFFEFFIIFC